MLNDFCCLYDFIHQSNFYLTQQVSSMDIKFMAKAFIESNYYAIIKRFSYFNSMYTLQRTIDREREREYRGKGFDLNIKCIFLTNTIFSLRIKNGYLDVSGWWNLVQFRRWWEWAGDRILIWTFKNKVYTSHAGGGLRRGGGCDDIPREILLRTFKLSKNKCLEELPLFGFIQIKKYFHPSLLIFKYFFEVLNEPELEENLQF